MLNNLLLFLQLFFCFPVDWLRRQRDWLYYFNRLFFFWFCYTRFSLKGHSLIPFYPFIIGAFEHLYPAILNLPYFVGSFRNEITVMADKAPKST